MKSLKSKKSKISYRKTTARDYQQDEHADKLDSLQLSPVKKSQFTDLQKSNNLIKQLLNTLCVVKYELKTKLKQSQQWLQIQKELRQQIKTLKDNLQKQQVQNLYLSRLAKKKQQLQQKYSVLQKKLQKSQILIEQINIQLQQTKNGLVKSQQQTTRYHHLYTNSRIQVEQKVQQITKLTILLKQQQQYRLYSQVRQIQYEKQIQQYKKMIKGYDDHNQRLNKRQRLLQMQLNSVKSKQQQINILKRQNKQQSIISEKFRQQIMKTKLQLSFYQKYPIHQIQTDYKLMQQMKIIDKMKNSQIKNMQIKIHQFISQLQYHKKQLINLFKCAFCHKNFTKLIKIQPCCHNFCQTCKIAYNGQCGSCGPGSLILSIAEVQGSELIGKILQDSQKLEFLISKQQIINRVEQK